MRKELRQYRGLPPGEVDVSSLIDDTGGGSGAVDVNSLIDGSPKKKDGGKPAVTGGAPASLSTPSPSPQPAPAKAESYTSPLQKIVQVFDEDQATKQRTKAMLQNTGIDAPNMFQGQQDQLEDLKASAQREALLRGDAKAIQETLKGKLSSIRSEKEKLQNNITSIRQEGTELGTRMYGVTTEQRDRQQSAKSGDVASMQESLKALEEKEKELKPIVRDAIALSVYKANKGKSAEVIGAEYRKALFDAGDFDAGNPYQDLKQKTILLKTETDKAAKAGKKLWAPNLEFEAEQVRFINEKLGLAAIKASLRDEHETILRNNKTAVDEYRQLMRNPQKNAARLAELEKNADIARLKKIEAETDNATAQQDKAIEKYPRVKWQENFDKFKNEITEKALNKARGILKVKTGGVVAAFTGIDEGDVSEQDIKDFSVATGMPEEEVRKMSKQLNVASVPMTLVNSFTNALDQQVVGTQRFFNSDAADKAAATNRGWNKATELPERLKLIQSDKDGKTKYNFTPLSIMQTASETLGQVGLYALEGYLGGQLLGAYARGISVVEKATAAAGTTISETAVSSVIDAMVAAGQKGATFASGFAGSYEDAYQEGLRYSNDEGKARAYANWIGGITGMSELILPDVDLAKRLAGVAKLTPKVFDNMVYSMKLPAAQSVMRGLGELANVVGSENVEELMPLAAKVFAQDGILGRKIPAHEMFSEALDTIVQTTIGTLPLGIGGGIRNSSSRMLNEALYTAGMDAGNHLSRISEMEASGQLEPAEASRRRTVIRTLNEITKQFTHDDSGNALSEDDRIALTAQEYRRRWNQGLLNNPNTTPEQAEAIRVDMQEAELNTQAILNPETPAVVDAADVDLAAVAVDDVDAAIADGALSLGAPLAPLLVGKNDYANRVIKENGLRSIDDIDDNEVFTVSLSSGTGRTEMKITGANLKNFIELPVTPEAAPVNPEVEENRRLDNLEIDEKIARLDPNNIIDRVKIERLQQEKKEVNDYYDNYQSPVNTQSDAVSQSTGQEPLQESNQQSSSEERSGNEVGKQKSKGKQKAKPRTNNSNSNQQSQGKEKIAQGPVQIFTDEDGYLNLEGLKWGELNAPLRGLRWNFLPDQGNEIKRDPRTGKVTEVSLTAENNMKRTFKGDYATRLAAQIEAPTGRPAAPVAEAAPVEAVASAPAPAQQDAGDAIETHVSNNRPQGTVAMETVITLKDGRVGSTMGVTFTDNGKTVRLQDLKTRNLIAEVPIENIARVATREGDVLFSAAGTITPAPASAPAPAGNITPAAANLLSIYDRAGSPIAAMDEMRAAMGDPRVVAAENGIAWDSEEDTFEDLMEALRAKRDGTTTPAISESRSGITSSLELQPDGSYKFVDNAEETENSNEQQAGENESTRTEPSVAQGRQTTAKNFTWAERLQGVFRFGGITQVGVKQVVGASRFRKGTIKKTAARPVTEPILLWRSRDGKIYVLDGRRRLQDALDQGQRYIPSRFLSGTEEDAYEVAQLTRDIPAEQYRKARKDRVLAAEPRSFREHALQSILPKFGIGRKRPFSLADFARIMGFGGVSTNRLSMAEGTRTGGRDIASLTRAGILSDNTSRDPVAFDDFAEEWARANNFEGDTRALEEELAEVLMEFQTEESIISEIERINGMTTVPLPPRIVPMTLTDAEAIYVSEKNLQSTISTVLDRAKDISLTPEENDAVNDLIRRHAQPDLTIDTAGVYEELSTSPDDTIKGIARKLSIYATAQWIEQKEETESLGDTGGNELTESEEATTELNEDGYPTGWDFPTPSSSVVLPDNGEMFQRADRVAGLPTLTRKQAKRIARALSKPFRNKVWLSRDKFLQAMGIGGSRQADMPPQTEVRPAGENFSIFHSNPKPLTEQEYKAAYGKKYTENRTHWYKYLNRRMSNGMSLHGNIMSLSAKYGIPADILFTSAMEEGMELRFTKPDDVSEAYFNAEKDLAGFPVDGFLNYGLDHFGSMFPKLVKDGLLPESFASKFKSYPAFNELKEKVKTAAFATDIDALTAKAAVMSVSRNDATKQLQKLNIPATENVLNLATLLNYNMGGTKTAAMLASFNEKGYLRGDAFMQKDFTPSSWKDVFTNVEKRQVNALALSRMGYFSNAIPQTMAKNTVMFSRAGLSEVAVMLVRRMDAARNELAAATRAFNAKRKEMERGVGVDKNDMGSLSAERADEILSERTDPQKREAIMQAFAKRVTDAKQVVNSVKAQMQKTFTQGEVEQNLFSKQISITGEFNDTQKANIVNTLRQKVGENEEAQAALAEIEQADFPRDGQSMFNQVTKVMRAVTPATQNAEVVAALNEAGVSEVSNEGAVVSIDRVSPVYNQNNEPLGIFSNGQMFLNPDVARIDTPFHEIGGHALGLWARENQPELYAKMLSVARQAPAALVSTIKRIYPELGDTDKFWEEVFAHVVGLDSRNVERMNAIAADRPFWQSVRDTINEIYLAFYNFMVDRGIIRPAATFDINEFRDMTLADFANLVGEKLTTGRRVSAPKGPNLRGFSDYSFLSNDDFILDNYGNAIAVKQDVMDDIAAEKSFIKEQAVANATYMLAPDGTRSALTEDQWLTVRTRRFQAWDQGYDETAFSVESDVLQEPKPVAIAEERLGNNGLKGVYLNLREKGFNKQTLQQIEAYAQVIEAGGKYTRFTEEQLKGFRRGGRIHAEASLITGGSHKAGETYKGKKLEYWEGAERQEDDLKKYAKKKGIWIDDVNKHLTNLYGERFDAGAEAQVWRDPNRSVVIKSVSTTFYKDAQLFLDGITLHNAYFPETAITVTGFGYDPKEQQFNVIIEQAYINVNKEGRLATIEETDALAAESGFAYLYDDNGFHDMWTYQRDGVHVFDLHDGNVLIGENGKFYVVDSTMSLENPPADAEVEMPAGSESRAFRPGQLQSRGRVLRNDHGEPKIFYHGTMADFSTFRGDKANYFADPDHANNFTKMWSWKNTATGGNMQPSFLRANKPFDVRKPEHRKLYEEAQSLGMVQPLGDDGTLDSRDVEGLRRYFEASKQPFDAVLNVYENIPSMGAKSSVAILNPKNIKSAISNSTFSDEHGDVRFQRIGEGSALTPNQRQNLEQANKMEAAAATPSDIHLATGWFRGLDNKWRYELPNDNVRFLGDVEGTAAYFAFRRTANPVFDKGNTPEQVRQAAMSDVLSPVTNEAELNKLAEITQRQYLLLEDVLEYPELYEAHPDLRNMKVYLRDIKGYGGAYNPKNDDIEVNRNMLKIDQYMILRHEIQHALQERLGFEQGANKWVARQYYDRKLRQLRLMKQKADDLYEDLMERARRAGVRSPSFDSMSDQAQRQKERVQDLRDAISDMVANETEIIEDYYRSYAGEIEANEVMDTARGTKIDPVHRVTVMRRFAILWGDNEALKPDRHTSFSNGFLKSDSMVQLTTKLQEIWPASCPL